MNRLNEIQHPLAIQHQNRVRNVPPQFKKFAEDQEAIFLKLMLEQMNKTAKSEDDKSQAASLYKSLMTSERANLMAQSGQFGIQKMILNQIYPARRQHSLVGNHQKPNAPTAHGIELYRKEALK